MVGIQSFPFGMPMFRGYDPKPFFSLVLLCFDVFCFDAYRVFLCGGSTTTHYIPQQFQLAKQLRGGSTSLASWNVFVIGSWLVFGRFLCTVCIYGMYIHVY